jgi:hypothetical protein
MCLTLWSGTGIIAVAKFRQWDWVRTLSDVLILLHPDAVGVHVTDPRRYV